MHEILKAVLIVSALGIAFMQVIYLLTENYPHQKTIYRSDVYIRLALSTAAIIYLTI